jgi:hypothetical protein
MAYRSSCIALLLACVASAAASDLPDAPGHRFWDRTNKILLTTHAALETADFIATHHNLSRGGRELSWMAKPLCERGTAGQVAFFTGREATVAAASYLLHRTGHHKLERWFIVASSLDSAVGVTYSFSHR